eukprot:9331059-Alexandrium_andersonii.AAC.1
MHAHTACAYCSVSQFHARPLREGYRRPDPQTSAPWRAPDALLGGIRRAVDPFGEAAQETA